MFPLFMHIAGINNLDTFLIFTQIRREYIHFFKSRFILLIIIIIQCKFFFI